MLYEVKTDMSGNAVRVASAAASVGEKLRGALKGLTTNPSAINSSYYAELEVLRSGFTKDWGLEECIKLAEHTPFSVNDIERAVRRLKALPEASTQRVRLTTLGDSGPAKLEAALNDALERSRNMQPRNALELMMCRDAFAWEMYEGGYSEEIKDMTPRAAKALDCDLQEARNALAVHFDSCGRSTSRYIHDLGGMLEAIENKPPEVDGYGLTEFDRKVVKCATYQLSRLPEGNMISTSRNDEAGRRVMTIASTGGYTLAVDALDKSGYPAAVKKANELVGNASDFYAEAARHVRGLLLVVETLKGEVSKKDAKIKAIETVAKECAPAIEWAAEAAENDNNGSFNREAKALNALGAAINGEASKHRVHNVRDFTVTLKGPHNLGGFRVNPGAIMP